MARNSIVLFMVDQLSSKWFEAARADADLARNWVYSPAPGRAVPLGRNLLLSKDPNKIGAHAWDEGQRLYNAGKWAEAEAAATVGGTPSSMRSTSTVTESPSCSTSRMRR